jgi:hypothetical protein
MRERLLVIFFMFLLMSCSGGEEKRPYMGPRMNEIEASILKVNQYILKRNLDHIRGFIRRTGWDMKKTGSGLFYSLIKEGKGDFAENGKIISLNYTLKLIDGTLISSSDESGTLDFRIGQGGIPSGLEEAVLMTREGSEMRLILLPHLGYGNFGDTEKAIPPDAILLYEISVNKVM